ncbi:MAG: hypothetical protein JOZ60_04535 [Verrucomicrobia bacterium]|nr:hypothetical protein [Verrucomicrobiota bacterium]
MLLTVNSRSPWFAGNQYFTLHRFQERSRSFLRQLIALAEAQTLLSRECLDPEKFVDGCAIPIAIYFFIILSR